METIWEEDVKSFSAAYDLICIVDQIHEYAINYHRPFVIKHLEAWHARHQRLVASTDVPMDGSSAQESEATDLNTSNAEDGGNNALRIAANEDDWNQAERAEWYRLKQRSKAIQDAKMKDSREKKRKRRMEAEADVLAAEPSDEETNNASISTTIPSIRPISEYSIDKAKAKRWLESM